MYIEYYIYNKFREKIPFQPLCIWHKGDNNVLCIPFRWLQSAKGTVLTMICSFGGGSTGLVLCYIFYGGHVIHIGKMVTTVMGSLVRYSTYIQ